MSERLSRFGVGPKIATAVAIVAVAALFLSREFPEICLIAAASHPTVAVLGWVLVGAGVALWLAGLAVVMRAYNRDELVTTGVYRIVRHPMYSGWIVLILPGLMLISTSWPVLAASLAGYVVFKRSIHREDEYLAKRFGGKYLDYRASVHEILPIPRRPVM